MHCFSRYVGQRQDSLPLWHDTSINFAVVDELVTLEVKSRLNVGQRPAQQTQQPTIWASRLQRPPTYPMWKRLHVENPARDDDLWGLFLHSEQNPYLSPLGNGISACSSLV